MPISVLTVALNAQIQTSIASLAKDTQTAMGGATSTNSTDTTTTGAEKQVAESLKRKRYKI